MFRRPARRAARRTVRRSFRRTRRRMVRRTVLVGGMVLLAASGTAAAMKLSSGDAQRIEEHTGLPPQDLEDQDLEQAMQELNIQAQSLTPQDQARLVQQDAVPAVPDPNIQAAQSREEAPPVLNQPDYLAELEKLGELKEKGILTDEEFQAKKKQILEL